MKHVARKRFGQNFLHDDNVLTAITESIDPRPDDVMVEIGPGLAAMTDQLTRTLNHMHVVELDRAGNRVIVGDDSELRTNICEIRDVNWISFASLEAPIRAMVKIRHRHGI